MTLCSEQKKVRNRKWNEIKNASIATNDADERITIRMVMASNSFNHFNGASEWKKGFALIVCHFRHALKKNIQFFVRTCKCMNYHV